MREWAEVTISTGGQGRYGHVQHHQQSGVQDNSAQWAAYYASQAATAASTAAVVPAPAASAGDQPKRDAYYEDFFRYAAHYGEKAAREYYGAWSPPEGTPIPSENAGTAVGGTAANGSGAAATATAASSAPVGYGSASNSADAKDSRRQEGIKPSSMDDQEGIAQRSSFHTIIVC